jgi:hypothetical protein
MSHANPNSLASLSKPHHTAAVIIKPIAGIITARGLFSFVKKM